MKGLLLTLAIFNAVAAVAVVGLAEVGVGVRKGVVVSKYAELPLNGVIDQKALAGLEGGRFAGEDWARFPDWLNEGEDQWAALAWGAATVLAVNGVVFGVLWRRTGGGDRAAGRGEPAAKG